MSDGMDVGAARSIVDRLSATATDMVARSEAAQAALAAGSATVETDSFTLRTDVNGRIAELTFTEAATRLPLNQLAATLLTAYAEAGRTNHETALAGAEAMGEPDVVAMVRRYAPNEAEHT